MIATARKVIAQNGVLGLYRGYSMGATREGIFCSSYIAINPSIKKWMKETLSPLGVVFLFIYTHGY